MSRRPIVAGCYVESAEGTRYRVSYYDMISLVATLYPDDGGATVELPIAELKRVADPRKQLPPIEGLPKDRPICPWCDRPLKPQTEHFHAAGMRRRVIRRQFIRWNAKHQLFCTYRCAVNFATAAHAAGYRIISKPKGAK